MRDLSKIKTFRNGDQTVINMVVETPKGSRAKYKFQSKTGAFELHKALALGFGFPFPFGFIPGTRGDDGDPLDVLLVTTLEPPMGAVVPARVIGTIKLVQQDRGDKKEQRNDRFVAVPDVDHEDRPIEALADLPFDELHDIEEFFVQSGGRDGKRLRILDRTSADAAIRLIKAQLR